MERACNGFLDDWFKAQDRKPLVIRGARQVGKTWLVRDFAKRHQLQLIELNFERKPQLAGLFASNEPKQILLNLSASENMEIIPANSLLFLDEIQAVPELFAKLRWFAEDMPELPVIAAGSLLEFVLEDHTFSMPVGRISYMHLEPFSFEEYLLAQGKKGLLDYLISYQWGSEIPYSIHEQLLTYVKEYILIGGMPKAVSHWKEHRSFQEISRIHQDLLATYRDDAAKYRKKIALERLDEVIMAVPKYLGEKFVYTRVNPLVQTEMIKQALGLLCKARVCHRVSGVAANGVPLAAEIQEKYLKVIFLDIGLCSAALGLTLDALTLLEELTLINKGGIAEQLTGQLLRTLFPYYFEPALYYWHRDMKGSSAEIDYVFPYQNRVIPIEVKAGSTGSLKSLHYFMGLKGLSLAVRTNSDRPSKTDVLVKDHEGNQIAYTLLSIPFYLLGQLRRLLS